MRFINDRQLADMPALANLPADQRDQALSDATKVYNYVDNHPFVSREDLIAAAAAQGVSVERLNAAVQVLKATNRLLEVPDAVAAGLTPAEPSIPA